MACIRVRRNRYVLDFRDAFGRRRWRAFPKTKEGKEDADQALSEALRASSRHRAALVDDRITVAEYAKLWLSPDRLRLRPLGPQSLMSYEQAVRLHIVPTLGHLRVKDLRRAVLRAWLEAESRRGLERTTISKLLGVARTMLAAAVDDEILEANPAGSLGRSLALRTQEPEKINAMSRDELLAFLEAVRRGEQAVQIVTLAWTGLRIGELYGLQGADLDFDGRGIHVQRQVHTSGLEALLKTRHARRQVDMASDLGRLLRLHVAQRREQDLARGRVCPWLFLPDGPPSTRREEERLRTAMARALAAAGLPGHFTPHDLRHTFARQLLEDGRDVIYVQRQLGHSSIKITVDTYGRWARPRDPDAVDRLAERSGGGQLVLDLPRKGEIVGFPKDSS